MRLRVPPYVTRWSPVVVIVIAVILVAFPSAGDASVRMIGPNGRAPGLSMSRSIDEETIVLSALAALIASRSLRDPELDRLPADFATAYARMRATEGSVPTPVLATQAGLEKPVDFDVLVIDDAPAPRGALVFLHGFGGSFTLPCWEVAQAARRANLVTYCPAMARSGAWWTGDGEAALRRTLSMVRARGIDRIWLAGLSNGAIGASRLAPKLRGSLRGLVLVSGAAPEAAAPGVPVLVVQGRADAMCPARSARAYARRYGAKYVDLEGGHFAMLTHREQAIGAIGDFLEAAARSKSP